MFAHDSSLRRREFLLVMGIALVFPYLSSLRRWLDPTEPKAAGLTIGIWSSIALELATLAVLAYVLFRQDRSWQSLGLSFTWKDLLHSIGLFIGSYIISYGAYLVAFVMTFLLTGTPLAVQAKNVSFIQRGDFISLLVFIFINAWFEEIIVRAFAMTEVTALTGRVWLALLLSVLLQTGYHFYQGLLPMLMNSIVFCLFALDYALTRRALPLVLAHFYFDLLALLMAR